MRLGFLGNDKAKWNNFLEAESGSLVKKILPFTVAKCSLPSLSRPLLVYTLRQIGSLRPHIIFILRLMFMLFLYLHLVDLSTDLFPLGLLTAILTCISHTDVSCVLYSRQSHASSFDYRNSNNIPYPCVS